jgi:hypothetical protein
LEQGFAKGQDGAFTHFRLGRFSVRILAGMRNMETELNYPLVRDAILRALQGKASNSLRDTVRQVHEDKALESTPESQIKFIAIELIERGEVEMLPDLKLRLAAQNE